MALLTALRARLNAQHRQRLNEGLPAGEQEVVAFGTPLWPSDRSYSFAELVPYSVLDL